MSRERLLVVEDEEVIRLLLEDDLGMEGYEVATAGDGETALSMARTHAYDVIILDVMLPGKDGFQVCRELRESGVSTPILMLTAKSQEIDKVLGLEIGADDYITKPFSIRELVARVKSVLRRGRREIRPPETEDRILECGNFYLNVPKRIVRSYGQQVELSPKEFDLLVLLASNPGKTYSRSDLLSQVWGVDFEGFEHTVNSHINRLRSKIEKDMNQPEFIQTTWGVGYKFKDEAS